MAIDAPRCQGLRVNTQKPCRITKHLNADGFCKLHAPDALQCRGTAKATGARCRIKWDLNGDQLCQFHTAQASDAKVPKDARGSATAASAKPSVEREGGEDAKTLEPENKSTTAVDEATPATTTQCRGTAKSTGARCRISKGLNGEQLCKYHAHQSSAPSTRARAAPVDSATKDTATKVSSPVKASSQQCRGVALSTGKGCKISWDLNDDGFCKYHAGQAPTARAATTTTPAAVSRASCTSAAASSCRGVAASTGRKCRIAWDLDANGYCKFHGAQHRHARL